ncbi:MAG: GDP-mannose dehydrogenase, partial [Desulfobacterales bacterium]
MQDSKQQQDTRMDGAVSVCPRGEVFKLPDEKDYQKEFKSLQRQVKEERLKGREIVVVMGVGFVGAV